jgi:hypothetical protein
MTIDRIAQAPPVLAVILYLGASSAGFAQSLERSSDFEKCKVIGNDQARLNCLKSLLPPPSPGSTAPTAADQWQLVRTPHPKGGRDAVAIMRTVDTARSDPDLAGLIIRCGERAGLEVALALVRPFPPRSRRSVLINAGTAQSVLQAEASATGTALVLPIEATAFTTGGWRGLEELAVTIKDPEIELHGVIPLGGVAPAMAKLTASCLAG